MANASTDDLRAEAANNGMVTLRDAGMTMAFDGVTTLDEVVRETVSE